MTDVCLLIFVYCISEVMTVNERYFTTTTKSYKYNNNKCTFYVKENQHCPNL